MAEIDFETRQVLYSLIEYCRIYQLNATDFIGEFLPGIGRGTMRPDLQSERHNTGIECTGAGLFDVYRAMNDEKRPVASYFTSYSSSPVRLIKIVSEKTEKLNRLNRVKKLNGVIEEEEHYKKFDINALFIKVPIELYFSNCNDVCRPINCKKATNCDDCTNSNRISYVGDESINLQAVALNCSEDDCKKHKICTVGAFVNALQKSFFAGEFKYNPIILSKDRYDIGEDRGEYCCWIINTNDYTIIERRGKRFFLESERDIIEELNRIELGLTNLPLSTSHNQPTS